MLAVRRAGGVLVAPQRLVQGGSGYSGGSAALRSMSSRSVQA